MKLKIHPLFYVLAIYFICIGKVALFGGYVLSIVVHEYSHILAARLRGYHLGQCRLMPYGGKVTGYTYHSIGDGLIIAFSGPIANFVLAFCIVAIWWFFPKSYEYTIDLCRSSIALGFVNLIPVYPLDGSQIFFLFSKNKIKVSKLIKNGSYIFGAIFIILTIVSVFYSFNITMAIFGIFIILSTYFDRDSTLFNYVYLSCIKHKNYENGLRQVVINVQENMPIFKLLGKINSNEIIEFNVVNKENCSLGIITEKKLSEMVECLDISEPVKNIIRLINCK